MDDEKNTLEELIKAIAGEDPFWRMLLTKYLDGLSSKSEKDKIYFLNKLGKNVELSSNFLKEINRNYGWKGSTV